MARARRTAKRVPTPLGTWKVAGKSANGEGSIYWDKSKKRFRATWKDRTGKIRRASGASREEAIARREEQKQAEPTGDALGPAPTVADLTAYYVTYVAAPTLKPGSVQTYQKQADRITDYLGALHVADLDLEQVRRFVAWMREPVANPKATGKTRPRYSVSTVRNTRTMLRQVCAEGKTLGYLKGDNPVDSVAVPRAAAAERRKARALTAAEVRDLLEVLDPAERSLDAAIAVLFATGRRASEVLGLAWSDLDVEAGTVTIRRAATHISGQGVILDTPKSVNSTGIVAHLGPTVTGIVKAHRSEQARRRLEAGPLWEDPIYEGETLRLVFPNDTGGPVPRQRLDAYLRRAIDRAGINPDGIGTHTARRTVASLGYQAGLSVDDLQGLLGHAQASTTAGYVVDRGQRPEAAARTVQGVIDPDPVKNSGSG